MESMMMKASTLQQNIISESNFIYRGEGNASLVISLIHHDKGGNEVIRLKKQDPHKHWSKDDIWKEMHLQTEYSSKVMQPLLGSACVHCPERRKSRYCSRQKSCSSFVHVSSSSEEESSANADINAFQSDIQMTQA